MEGRERKYEDRVKQRPDEREAHVSSEPKMYKFMVGHDVGRSQIILK